jgi:hypothetical protein
MGWGCVKDCVEEGVVGVLGCEGMLEAGGWVMSVVQVGLKTDVETVGRTEGMEGIRYTEKEDS